MKTKFNHETFSQFEKRYDCFNQNIGGVYFWDIIRYELYLDILRNIKPGKVIINETKKISIFKKSIRLLKHLLSLVNFLLFTKCDFLFITSSRETMGNGGGIDRNLGDILNVCKSNSVLFEKYEINSSRLYYKSKTLFDPSTYIKLILSRFFKRYDYSQILTCIYNEFEDCNFTNERINEMIVNYKTDLLFYNFIFKIKKPKICFVNQNGIQKGLFSAGENYKVPIVEVQHCEIDKANPAYHYSEGIIYKKEQLYLPSYFFTFSDYWNKQVNYPVKKIISIGNSFLFQQPNLIDYVSVKKNALVVASANIYGENLKKIVIQLAQKSSELPIYFKLHPNQFAEREYYTAEFAAFKNVQVFSSEKSIGQLLMEAEAILVIQSTTIYEALHLKKKGIIYKKQSYEGHSSLFDNPNLYLIDTAEEIIKAINQPFIVNDQNEQIFYKDFDLKKFERFLADVI